MNIRFLAFSVAFFACITIVIPAHAAEPVLPGDLIKGSGSAVYYYYGDRYAFPNEDVYFSWYKNFDDVKTVSDEFLASAVLVGNVRIKPGTNMVKITTDPKVYFIDNGNELRWLPSEADAVAMYGAEWAKEVRDVSDALFIDYRLGEPMNTSTLSDMLPLATQLRYREIGDALKKMSPKEPAPLETFLRYPSILAASSQTAHGYTATTTEPLESLKSFYMNQSTDWDLLYEDFVQSSFGDGYILNYGQTRAERFAHRSIAISVVSSTNAFPTVEFLESEFPDGFIAYPRLVTSELDEGPRMLFQQGITKDHLDEIVPWYKEIAAERGWELIKESDAGSLAELAQVRRLFFQKPWTHRWLQIEVTQVGESFIEFTGDLSIVTVKYLH
jgi:hypothetical protein